MFPYYEFLAAAMVFVGFVAIGGGVLALLRARDTTVRDRLETEEPPPVPPQFAGSTLRQVLNRTGSMMVREPSRSLGERLARAGYHSRPAPAIFLGAKLLLMVGGAAGVALLLAPLPIQIFSKLVLVVVVAAAGFMLPDFHLEARRRRRRLEIRRHLPDVIDLLEVCVCSGMALDMAWNMIGDEIRSVCPVLADEMVLTNLETNLGAPRVAAIRNMARRTAVDEVASFATLLAQSERFGTSIADSLKTFAVAMRQERTARAQEYAEKTAVKLLFPMVLFIFPALLVVLAGPAAIKLIEVIGGG